MKKLVLPFALVAIIVALYEHSKEKPNVYILCCTVVVFIYGIIRLSAKKPSKNQEEKEQNDTQ